MENKSSGWCNLSGVILFLMGVSYVSTLILIPIAIYCFIGSSKYFNFAKISDVQLSNQKKSLKNWAIFTSIFAFPIGLVSVIPAVKSETNPVVSDITVEPVLNEEQQNDTKEPKIDEEVIKKEDKPQVDTANKQETIDKLTRFRDEGLITEAEFKKALKELQGDI